MKKIVLIVVLIVVIGIMTSCTFDGIGQESESNKQVVHAQAKVVLASEGESEPLEVEEEKTREQLVDVEIIRGPYNSFWDYMEYGTREDYFHPEELVAQFKFSLEGYDYHCGVNLEPPSYRALVYAFPKLETPKDEGYQAKISYQKTGDCKYISIISINDSTGSKVWDYEKTRDPRVLNLLEEWSIKLAQATDSEYLIEAWFDYKPVCNDSDGFLNECNRFYSPSEEFARFNAFNLKVTDPAQNVWVQNRIGEHGSDYRWVDYQTGVVLRRIDTIADLWELPSSGVLALQVKGDEGLWETTYMVDNVGPGWVMSVNEKGELFEAASIEFSNLSDYEKILRTIAWSCEEMIFYLLQFSCDDGVITLEENI